MKAIGDFTSWFFSLFGAAIREMRRSKGGGAECSASLLIVERPELKPLSLAEAVSAA